MSSIFSFPYSNKEKLLVTFFSSLVLFPLIFALRDIVFYSYVLSVYFDVPFSTLHDTIPLIILTYLYNRKKRRIPPITIVHPIIEPLSPMQSNSPLIIEKIQYIIYTRNRPRPTPNSSQKNNDIIFYIII